MPYLSIDHLVRDTRAHELYKKITTLGASEDNDIVCQGIGMEDAHAVIYLENNGFEIEPASRKAEIFINGKRIKKKTAFAHQDKLTFGTIEAQFSLFGESPKTAQADHSADYTAEAFLKLQKLAEDLTQTYNVESILTHVMDDVIALVHADKGFLLLIRDGKIHSQVSRNYHQESIDDSLFSDSIVRHVIETKQPLIVRDALNDENFNASQSVIDMRFCSVMCTPLVDRGTIIGLIYVGNDNIVSQFKPQHLEALRLFAAQISLILANAILVDDLTFENKSLASQIEDLKFGNIIGNCQPMREIFGTVKRVAATDVTVLIEGETGTGKELIAQELHRQSNRAKGPFVVINCGAIPANLLESELFGHVKGAFTGAIQTKLGKFQQANGGTLFLDEIGEMPQDLQVKLLRVLQERYVIKVGSNNVENIDIRIVAATNKNLELEVAEGRFREDLFYRLNVISLQLPPLRDRGDDVILIAKGLIERHAKEFNMVAKSLSPEAIMAIKKYRWPGNVRQLENYVKKALILSNKAQICAEDLGLIPEVLKPVMSLAEAKDDFQRRYINEVLELNNGNRSKTARDLGVDPRTIFRHLEKQNER
ncbi:MAG: sigma 54-interacting transcriptional regulator [Proteobacteria bacterium]|nr:sigma 54-interacting transcriptional regulator [Pseudomonadota bacterium]